MPTADPEGFAFHWTDVTAFLGVGLVGDRLRRLAPARQASRSRSRIPTSPNRCGTGSHEQTATAHERSARPDTTSEDEIDFTEGDRGRRRLARRSSRSARSGRSRILHHETARSSTPTTGVPRTPASSARRRSASSTRCCSRATTGWRPGAPSAPRASTATAGSIAARASSTSRSSGRWTRSAGGALPDGSAQVKLAECAARSRPRARRWRACSARARRARASRRSSSRRGASSRWPRCRTSTSSSTSAIAFRAGLPFTDVTGAPVSLDALLGPGPPGAGDARLPPLPDAVRPGARRPRQGGEDASGLDAGQGLQRRRHQHRSRPRTPSCCSSSTQKRRGRQRRGKPPPRADWPFWLVVGRRRRGGAHARRRGRLSLQVRPDVEAVRPRRGRLRADARRRDRRATSTASTTRPATSAWRWSRPAAAASGPRSTR